MRDRVEFFLETFKGIGFGTTISINEKFFIYTLTFLCFNFYFEYNMKKN